MIELIVEADADRAAAAVADRIEAAVRRTPAMVLGLAAGDSPRPVHRLLVERRLPAAELHLALLDEYLGLDAGHPASFRHQLDTELAGPLAIPPGRIHTLDGTTPDPDAECRRFEQQLAELGGVGLQLLGIGVNGHVAFNEPGSAPDSRTRLVQLSEHTRAVNARAFAGVDEVPRFALTQGIGTILEARRLVLLATGTHKADAVASALEGPIGVAVPASAVRRHPDVVVVLDRDAAGALTG